MKNAHKSKISGITQADALRGKQKKKIKLEKVPPGAEEEPTPLQRTSYSEEPIKKGKSKYAEEELEEEEETTEL